MSIIPPAKNSFMKKVTRAEMDKKLEDMPMADKLFRRKFAVFVPAAYLYSEEDFARGVPVTGDKDRDRQSAQELEQAFIPIAPDTNAPGPNILEFFEQEIPCQFRYDKDVVTVTNILSEHFRTMAEYINMNPLINKEKLERIMGDLQRFDALAARLHPAAHSLLPKHLGSDTVESRLRMLLKPKMGTGTIPEAPKPGDEIPEYQSFTTGINRNVLKGTKRWR